MPAVATFALPSPMVLPVEAKLPVLRTVPVAAASLTSVSPSTTSAPLMYVCWTIERKTIVAVVGPSLWAEQSGVELPVTGLTQPPTSLSSSPRVTSSSERRKRIGVWPEPLTAETTAWPEAMPTAVRGERAPEESTAPVTASVGVKLPSTRVPSPSRSSTMTLFKAK